MTYTLSDMLIVQKALTVATKAHDGQFREDGKTPYIEHPIAVAKQFPDIDQQIVALLHDVVEDTPVTMEYIEREFGEVTAEHVEALTKREGEDYVDFIKRVVKGGRIPIQVKLADIKHNLSDSKKGARRDKYMLAAHILDEALWRI